MFFSLFSMLKERVSPLPPPAVKRPEPAPFTTQKELLEKYTPGETNVGICRSLSNVYAKEILQGRDPSLLLANDRALINAAINEENVEYRLQGQGLSEKDVSGLAFTLYSTTPPATGIVKAGEMNKVLDDTLIKKDHVLLVIPTDDTGVKHEVYFGRDNVSYSNSKTNCRFFDANLEGGERSAPCSKLLPEFKAYLKETYPIDKDDGHFSAISHPRKP